LVLLMFTLFNFMGIPPLLGFWVKFYLIEGLLLQNSNSFLMLTCICILLLITLIGTFSYLKMFYALVTENVAISLSVAYWPRTKNNTFILFLFFISIQFFLVFLNKDFFIFGFYL
jgi:NADH:ubiquinone oxidoreductase subunit 2 (subunit N)